MNPLPQKPTFPPSPFRKVATLASRSLAVATLVLVAGARAWAQGDDDLRWTGTWAVSPLSQEGFLTNPAPAPPTFTNQTLRQVVRVSIGGTKVRVRLSNTFGTESLVIGSAHVARRGAGSQIQGGSDNVLTFGGRPSVTIPAGAVAVSDTADLAVPALSDLAVSIYLPNATPGRTLHSEGKQTNYIINGDQTGAFDPPVASTTLQYNFLTNVEVKAPAAYGAIVTLGDSITDGTASTPDTNSRWPNFLAQRLQAAGSDYIKGVLDQGISGNRLYNNVAGPNAMARFDRDVIAQAGVTDVTLLIGINDIGFGGFLPAQAVSAEDIIAAYRQIIKRAHEAGLRIFGCTLTPFAGVNPPYFSEEGEAKRQAVNNFIRTTEEFDGLIDFEAAVRDESNPPRLRAEFDSGDHLHPSDAGYQAMANAINLDLFRRTQ